MVPHGVDRDLTIDEAPVGGVRDLGQAEPAPESSMTALAPLPAGAGNAKRATSADAEPGQPAPVAVSPALGPLPAIYVSRSPGEAGAASLLRRVAAMAMRRAVHGPVLCAFCRFRRAGAGVANRSWRSCGTGGGILAPSPPEAKLRLSCVPSVKGCQR